MKQSKNEINLGEGSVGRLLLTLAVPSVIAQLVNLLYNLVDRIYIGHIPENGGVALTGLGLCFPILMIVTAFSGLIGYGGAPRVAIFMGKGKNDEAEEILGNCTMALIVIALILQTAPIRTVFIPTLENPCVLIKEFNPIVSMTNKVPFP